MKPYLAVAGALIATLPALGQDGLPPHSQPRTTTVDSTSEEASGRYVRKGTYRVGPVPPSKLIPNYSELCILKLLEPKAPPGVTTGWAFEYAGRDEKVGEWDRFLVDAIKLTSPDNKETRNLTRFEGTFSARFVDGEVLFTINGVERKVRSNHHSKLAAYLRADLRRALSDGVAYTVRGWTIDSNTCMGLERTLLLDGLKVRVDVSRLLQKADHKEFWAQKAYGDLVRLDPEDLDQNLSVSYAYKKKKVSPVRSAPRAGLTSSLDD